MPTIDVAFLEARLRELEAEVRRLEQETARAQGALRFTKFLLDTANAPEPAGGVPPPLKACP